METIRELKNTTPYADFIRVQRFDWTRTAYAQDLRNFKAFMDGRGLEPATVTRQDILDFAAGLAANGVTPCGRSRGPLSVTSQMHVLSTVKKFHQFLGAMGLVEKDPTLILPFLKLKKPGRLPRPLNHLDRGALLQSLRLDKRHHVGISLVVALGFHCGLRRSEMAGARVPDVDLYSKTLRVIGKGDKERILPLTDFCADILRRWFKVRQHVRSPWIFPGEKHPLTRHVKPQSLNTRLQVAAEWAGLRAPLTCHVLRHTFGTQLAETGATPYEIRDLMGHGTILMGEAYVKIASDAPRKAHFRAFGQFQKQGPIYVPRQSRAVSA